MTASKRTLIWLFMMVVAVALLSGCKSIQYVPVETVHTDTVYQKKVERDSIHVHDSITVREKGDSVIIDRWHTKFIDRLRTDTVYRSRTDSIAVPYPVEKKLSWWQQMKVDYSTPIILILVVALLILILWNNIKGLLKR